MKKFLPLLFLFALVFILYFVVGDRDGMKVKNEDKSVVIQQDIADGGSGKHSTSAAEKTKKSERIDNKENDLTGHTPQVAAENILDKAIRDAVTRQDRETFLSLLSTLQKNPTKYTKLLSLLALSPDLPPWARVSIIQLMRSMSDNVSLNALLQLSKTDDMENSIRAEALKALGARSEAQAESRLREIAVDQHDPGRAMALSFLGDTGEPESKETLLDAVRQGTPDDEEATNAALYSLRHFRDEDSINVLMEVAQDQSASPRLKATALYSLGASGVKESLPIIKDNLDSEEREVRYSAVLASTRVSDEEVSSALVGQLVDVANYPHVRKAAAVSLEKNATKEDLINLRRKMISTDGFGIVLGSEVLVAKGEAEALPLLKKLLNQSQDSYVIKKINSAIKVLQLEAD